MIHQGLLRAESVFLVYMFVLVASQNAGVNSVCSVAQDCKACIFAHPDCAWCSNTFFKDRKPTCVDSKTTSYNCSDTLINPQSYEDIVQNENYSNASELTTSSQDIIQMRPQRLTLRLRKGQTKKVNITFHKVIDYPLDLYYVMDLSNSMSDDLDTLKGLGAKLVNNIKDNITQNVEVGFGSFVDKVMMPYTSTVRTQLENPCAGGVNVTSCAPPFGFRHQLAITGNATEFQNAVQATKVSGNIDIPEGSFDALMQIAVCEEFIKWRPGSTRVILLTTDATPHIAMDGKLAAILEANDMKCHLQKGFNADLGSEAIVYAKSKTLDYPSLGQLKQAFTEHKIITIFAVTDDVLPVYQDISKVLKDLGEASQLASDSNNIVSIIADAYEKIKGRLVVRASSIPSHVTYSSKTYCSSGDIVDGVMDCNNISIGDEVTFELSFTANECMEGSHQINLTSSSLTDVVTIDLEYICDCHCPRQDANSTLCGNHGNLTCGMCECEAGWQGLNCQCESSTVDESLCFMQGGNGQQCEGHGQCDCGKCVCANGYNGTNCQCQTTGCAAKDNKLCGGPDKGWCNNCNGLKKCECFAPYTNRESDGGTCTCDPVNCQANGDRTQPKCSGKGACQCETCRCDDENKWGGTYCHQCKHPECTGITLACDTPRIKDCAQCKSRSDGCKEECPENDFLLFDKVTTLQNCQGTCSASDPGCGICSRYDPNHARIKCGGTFADGCSYSYDVYWTTDDRYHGFVKIFDTTTDCPAPINALVIVIPIVIGVVLLGIIALILWKLYTIRRDKRLWDEFEKERMLSNCTQGYNPTYEDPTATTHNPAFIREVPDPEPEPEPIRLIIEKVIRGLPDLERRLNLEILQNTDLDKCGLEWNDIRFFAIFYQPGKINHEELRLACEKRGAKLGNIYAKDQYDSIMDYLRRYIAITNDGGNAIEVRTGMRYEPKSQITSLADGSDAPFVHWRSGYPAAKPDQTTVILNVCADGSKHNGMFNMKSSVESVAMLCEIEI